MSHVLRVEKLQMTKLKCVVDSLSPQLLPEFVDESSMSHVTLSLVGECTGMMGHSELFDKPGGGAERSGALNRLRLPAFTQPSLEDPDTVTRCA